MIIIYDIDALKDNKTKATICRKFKKVMESIEINTEDPSFVLTIVRRSRDNNKLAIDSTSHCVFNKFDGMMLSYMGINIYKIPVIRLFTERLTTNERCPSMEIMFPDKQVSFEFNDSYAIWDKTEGDVVFDTRQYVLLCEEEMDQRFNKISDGKMTITYDLASIEAEYVSIIENKNFCNLLEKAGIDGSEIKHVTFKRIGYNRTTSHSSVLDNIYEALEDLMLYDLGIDIDAIGNIKRETKQTSHKNIPVIQVRFHGKQLVYDFDPTTFDWAKRDEISITEKGLNNKSKNITPFATPDSLRKTLNTLKSFNDLHTSRNYIREDLMGCESFKVSYNRDDHIIYCEIMVPYNVALGLMGTIKGIDTVESVEYRREHNSMLIKSKPLFHQYDLYLLDDTFASKTINYDWLINNIAYKHVILIACTIYPEYFVNIKVDDDTEIPFSVVKSISDLLLAELKDPKSFDEESKIETTFSYEDLLCVITSHRVGARRLLCTNIKLPKGMSVEQTNKLLSEEKMICGFYSDVSSMLWEHSYSYSYRDWLLGHGSCDCVYGQSRDWVDDVRLDETVALICVIRSIVKIIKIKKYEPLPHLICDGGVIYDFSNFHHIDIIESEFREVLNDVYRHGMFKEPRVETLSITRHYFHGIAYYIESFPNTDILDGSRSIYFTIITGIGVPLEHITDLIDDDRFVVEEHNCSSVRVEIKHKESITMNGGSSGTPVFDLYKECLFECLRIIDKTILCHTI